jgi:uncharacterized membrane protein YphA (DoxX/SURF4 family)
MTSFVHDSARRTSVVWDAVLRVLLATWWLLVGAHKVADPVAMKCCGVHISAMMGVGVGVAEISFGVIVAIGWRRALLDLVGAAVLSCAVLLHWLAWSGVVEFSAVGGRRSCGCLGAALAITHLQMIAMSSVVLLMTVLRTRLRIRSREMEMP